jgi:SAM-dependent methyltransferase
MTNAEVKDLVRDNYAKVAQNATACCSSDCCDEPSKLYNVELIKDLPAEVVMASAGCGNPTAIGELLPGETVVDFGSGGGIDCFIAAKAVGPEGKVVGVDMTLDMIKLARSNAEKLELSNVEFHLTEMEHTPLADDSADAIISNCVINLAPDKSEVFKEAFRILKPGGRAYISDMLLVNELPDEAREDKKNWVMCLSGAEPKDIYLGKMREAGFVDVQILEDTPWEGEQSWASDVHSMNIRAYKPS